MKNTNTNRRRNTNRPRKTIFAKPLFPEDDLTAPRTGSADLALSKLLDWDREAPRTVIVKHGDEEVEHQWVRLNPDEEGEKQYGWVEIAPVSV